MDLETVISQDILLLSPPRVNKCVSPGSGGQTAVCLLVLVQWTSAKKWNILFFVLFNIQPQPQPQICCWWRGWGDETRALDSRAVEQQAEDAGPGVPRMQRARRRCSGPGPGPSLGTPARGSSAGWALGGPVRSSLEQASVCLPSKTLLSPVLGSSAALRRWVSAPQLSWWPHCVLHQPAAVADQLQLLSPFSAASPATTTTLDN